MIFQNPELSFDQKQECKPYIDVLFEILTGDLDFHEDATYASHNYHSFPAKFPPQLPKAFIERLTQPGEVILDPMVGSGTCALEAYLNRRRAIGFDIDPLALRISRVKMTPLRAVEVVQKSKAILSAARCTLHEDQEKLQQALESRFDETTRKFFGQWFLPNTQLELLALLQQIEAVEQPDLKTFFEVCFSAIIITKSGGISLALDLGHTRPHLAKKVVDRSGNVLFNTTSEAPKHLTKVLRSVFSEFERRVTLNAAGLVAHDPTRYVPRIEYGNAQNLSLDDASVDLIVTSPPYASNAIDYMRAHKFSLAWFGYTIDQLGEKRREYIGGEATSDYVFEELPPLAAATVKTIREKDAKKGLVLHRYYSEMTRALKEMFRVIRPGKAAIVVVGNSMMRGIDTQTAQCLAEIGQSIGFQVLHIGVRLLNRDKRMMPAGGKIDLNSQIQQRMHEEYVIGFYKPA